MTSNPHELKHAPDVAPTHQIAPEPIPQWKLAAFLPLPWLIGAIICFWQAYKPQEPANPGAEIQAGFFLCFGVGFLIAYVVSLPILGFYGHALGLKIYPVQNKQ
jgi:hypothetical protein